METDSREDHGSNDKRPRRNSRHVHDDGSSDRQQELGHSSRKRARRDSEEGEVRPDSEEQNKRSGAGSDSTDFPDKLTDVQIHDSGGEISMSVEETNRLRISLGLKPLTEGTQKQERPRPTEADAQRKAEETKAKTEEIRERLAAAKERREQEEQLAKVKSLGVKDNDEDDDIVAWVQRSRALEEAKREEERIQAELEQHLEENEEEDDDDKYTAKDLAGLKVKHDYNEIGEGETVILTLADKGILDEKGQLIEEDDELENVLKAEDKKRRKARDAATKKGKPLFEEDGKKRSLLDKYDEEEEMALELNDQGALEAERLKRQEEIRKKLTAGTAMLEDAAPKVNAVGDYYTEAELAAITKPKRKKKERKLRAKVVEEDTMDIVEALEAEAELRGGGASDLGKRSDRAAKLEAAEQQRVAAVADKAARFEKALEKANWASQALRPNATIVTDEDDQDQELYESLARARRVAQQKEPVVQRSFEEMASELGKRREEDEAKLREQIKSGVEFTETTEFVRNIQLVNEPENKAPVAAGGDGGGSYMGVDEPEPEVVKMDEDVKGEDDDDPHSKGWGNWVAADKAKRSERAKAGSQPVPGVKEEPLDSGVTSERVVGRGLASCLGLLADKGQLRDNFEWAGRTNDKKKSKVQGLEDVYTGGSHEDQLARSVEVALTERDELGRILTPKERFRELCYRFHGKRPSKNKIEAKMKKDAESIALKKAATSERPAGELEKFKEVQKQLATPFVVLSGKGQVGSRSEYPELAKKKPGSLGGGFTPVSGNKKVEMMLGIKKPKGPGPSKMKPKT